MQDLNEENAQYLLKMQKRSEQTKSGMIFLVLRRQYHVSNSPKIICKFHAISTPNWVK